MPQWFATGDIERKPQKGTPDPGPENRYSPASPPPKELSPRTFQFTQLRGRFFFDRYEFVAELLSLPFEFRFEAFLSLGVPLRPKRRVVFDLLLHHRVEDDRDLMRSPRIAMPARAHPHGWHSRRAVRRMVVVL